MAGKKRAQESANEICPFVLPDQARTRLTRAKKQKKMPSVA